MHLSLSSRHQLGAIWDRGYAYDRGHALGTESRGRGVNVFLTPQISPSGGFPEGGRNRENFSPDPYLTGELVDSTVRGVQDNILVAMTGHFVANGQKRFRSRPEALRNKFVINENLSDNFDDRTMHENIPLAVNKRCQSRHQRNNVCLQLDGQQLRMRKFLQSELPAEE
ncbi:MAG: hypothetical protein Q9204_004811 [Flavoplaca sp. TL-2023a]